VLNLQGFELTPRSRLCALVFSLVAGWAQPALAAHPLQTEDTGTQGAGNVELENGLGWTHQGGAALFDYQPQWSYGASAALDLIVQPSWLSSRPAADGTAAPTTRGGGDTNLDFKWRFYGEAPWSYAVRAGVLLPTAQHGLGLPGGEIGLHGLAVVTYDAAPLTLHGNLGLTHNPAALAAGSLRTTQAAVSAAALWQLTPRWIVTADAGAGANADPRRKAWPATALAGVICTLQPGLDADIGYQASVRAAPAAREWLAGLTYRFAW
jgi:hypothetical protein